jgi:hypothetical protein
MDAAAVEGAGWVPTTRKEMLENVVAGIFARLGGSHPWGFMGNILDIGNTNGRVGFMADPVNVDPADAEKSEKPNYLRPIFAGTCRSKQDFLIFFEQVKAGKLLHADTRVTLFCGLSNPEEIHPVQEVIHPAQGENHQEPEPDTLDALAEITNTMGWDFSHLQLGKHGREDEGLPPTSPMPLELWDNGTAAQQDIDALNVPFGELGEYNEFFFADNSNSASLPFFQPPVTLTQKGPISLTDFSVEETDGLNDECLFIITAPTRVKLRPLMLIANQMPGILSVGTWLSRPSMSKYLRLLGLGEFKKGKKEWNFGTVYRNVGDIKLQITLGHAGTTNWGDL